MAETLLADGIDALVALLAADATLTAITGVKVFDGPPVTDRAQPVEVVVGSSGLDDEDEPTAITQVRAALDGDTYDETVDIPCCVWSIGGSADMQARRRSAVTAYEAIVDAVRGWDLSALTPDVTADVSGATLRQLQTPDGAQAHLMFTVRLNGFWS